MNRFLPIFHSKVFLIFSAMAVIALAIGIPSVIIKQQQNIKQNAETRQIGNHDSCGLLHFDFTESPVCPVGVGTRTNSYTYTVRVTSTTGGVERNFTYDTFNYFCTAGMPTGNCVDNLIQHLHLSARTPATITINRSPTVGAFCGSYQFDFRTTSVNGNTSCVFEGAGGAVGSSGACRTGVNCTPTPTPRPTLTPTSSPTPTARPTNTPTPTLRPTNIPTSTNAPTPTVRPTQTLTPTTTNSGTPIPTVRFTSTPTLTPIFTYTPTVTRNPSSTATPTETPAPTGAATSTPTPSLPATGPGNIFLNIGVVGAGIFLIGTLVLFIL